VYCCHCHDLVRNPLTCEICGARVQVASLLPELLDAAKRSREQLEAFITATDALFPRGLDGYSVRELAGEYVLVLLGAVGCADGARSSSKYVFWFIVTGRKYSFEEYDALCSEYFATGMEWLPGHVPEFLAELAELLPLEQINDVLDPFIDRLAEMCGYVARADFEAGEDSETFTLSVISGLRGALNKVQRVRQKRKPKAVKPLGFHDPNLVTSMPTRFVGPLEGAFGELQHLIGLSEVRTDVSSLANLVRLREKRRQAGLPLGSLSLHLVFTEIQFCIVLRSTRGKWRS
jgi:hypothetical protein